MELLQGSLESVFVSLLLSSMIAFPFRKLAEEEALWEAVVFHSCDVASPSELGLLQESLHTREFCKSQDFCIRGFIFPADAKNAPEAVHVEALKLSGVPFIEGPGLTCIQESWDDGCSVHFQL